jgi:hypothetical protein
MRDIRGDIPEGARNRVPQNFDNKLPVHSTSPLRSQTLSKDLHPMGCSAVSESFFSDASKDS